MPESSMVLSRRCVYDSPQTFSWKSARNDCCLKPIPLCLSEKIWPEFFKIIRAADITEDDFVVEIGPGIGTMTQYLASAAGHVVAIEIDKALIPILQDTLSGYHNVTILHNDVMKVDLEELAEKMNQGRPIKIVANLPYYITTPIIMGLFEKHVPLESITVMVHAGWARQQRLWGIVTGGSVLCRTIYCSQCTSKLFYAKAKSWIGCDSSDST